MSELGGPIAVGCPHATAVDEAHLVADRIAIIDRDQRLPHGGVVRALYATTVSPLAPQVAINLETGDYAVRGQPGCGCPFDRVGFAGTVHTVRSYEKLSTEGMHFFGPRLLRSARRRASASVRRRPHRLPAHRGGGRTRPLPDQPRRFSPNRRARRPSRRRGGAHLSCLGGPRGEHDGGDLDKRAHASRIAPGAGRVRSIQGASAPRNEGECWIGSVRRSTASLGVWRKSPRPGLG